MSNQTSARFAQRQLLSAAKVAEQVYGVSERKFHMMREAGLVPAPYVLGERCLRWERGECEESFSKLPRQMEASPMPKQLRRGQFARKNTGAASAASGPAVIQEPGHDLPDATALKFGVHSMSTSTNSAPGRAAAASAPAVMIQQREGRADPCVMPVELLTWTPVDVELPDDEATVLVWVHPAQDWYAAWREDGQWRDVAHAGVVDGVTHWAAPWGPEQDPPAPAQAQPMQSTPVGLR